ncbi:MULTISPECIES: hypothetical protein [unclassified Microcoleus]|nr:MULTISPECIES: hypothetical protein [unclassified Microcoleus]
MTESLYNRGLKPNNVPHISDNRYINCQLSTVNCQLSTLPSRKRYE